MKSIILAAALTMGGAAIAQETMQPEPTEQPADAAPPADTAAPPADQGMTPPADQGMTPPAAPSTAPPPADQGTMPPADQGMAPAPSGAGMAVAPGNQAPERDSRGIAVVSDAAEAPAGANQPPPAGAAVPAPNQAAVFAARPAEGEYQACSKTVTDNCVQNYERGRSPN